MLQARALLPFLLITGIHLSCLATEADLAADVTQIALMPVLALGLVWMTSAAARQQRLIRLTLAALAFSWLGDTLPRFLDGDAAFAAMVIGFLIAQGCYIAAFWPWVKQSVLHRPGLMTPYVVLPAFLLGLTVPAAGNLAVLVVIYGVTLALMGITATGLNALTWIGGAVFMASDALIALNAFDVWTVPGHDLWVMATYCSAQAFLVLGVVRLSSEYDDQQRPGTSSRPSPRLAG